MPSVGNGYVRVFQCETYGAEPLSAVGTRALAASRNVSAIQSAISDATAAGGGRVTIEEPGTYFLNDTLTIYSNIDLYVGPGVVLRMTPVSNKSMLKNVSFDATRTAVIGNPTASGKTITVSATAHGLAVGDYACLMGSTVDGYEGIFPVASVINANSLTLTADKPPASATSAGTCFIRKADANITLSGPGVFDQDQANQTFPVANTEVHAIKFQGVRNLNIHRVSVQNARKYALHLITTQDVIVDRPFFPITDSDGVHLEAMQRNVLVTGTSGKCGDDAVALTIMKASPGAVYGYTVPSNYYPGNMVDVTIDGIYVDTEQACFKLCGDANYSVDRVTVRDIGGSFRASAVSVIDDGSDLTGMPIRSLTIEGVRAVPDASASNIYHVMWTATGAVGTLTIRDFVQDVTTPISGGANMTGSTIDNFVIDNYATRNGAASSVVGLLFGSTLTVNKLTIDKVRWNAGANSEARFLYQNGAAIGLLQATNWSIAGDTLGNGHYHSGGTLTLAQYSDIRLSGARSVYENTTGATATPEIQMSNIAIQGGGQAVNLSQSTNVQIFGVRATSLNNNVIQIGATSRTFNIRAGQFAVPVAQHFLYGTTNTINLWADSTVHVDGTRVTVGTTTKGAMFFNSNAAFATGTGLYSISDAGSAVKLT